MFLQRPMPLLAGWVHWPQSHVNLHTLQNRFACGSVCLQPSVEPPCGTVRAESAPLNELLGGCPNRAAGNGRSIDVTTRGYREASQPSYRAQVRPVLFFLWACVFFRFSSEVSSTLRVSSHSFECVCVWHVCVCGKCFVSHVVICRKMSICNILCWQVWSI